MEFTQDDGRHRRRRRRRWRADGEAAAAVEGADGAGEHDGAGGVPADGGAPGRRRAAHRLQRPPLRHPHRQGMYTVIFIFIFWQNSRSKYMRKYILLGKKKSTYHEPWKKEKIIQFVKFRANDTNLECLRANFV